MSADYTSDDEKYRAYVHGSSIHVEAYVCSELHGAWYSLGGFDRQLVDDLDDILTELGM